MQMPSFANDRRVGCMLRHLTPIASFAIDHQPGQQLSVPREDGYTFTSAQGTVLSREQRDFYEANGFLVVRNNIAANEIAVWMR
jgi:hypothetical protein